MTLDLSALVPALYRERDVAAGGPLKALLGVIQEHLGALEADVARLYDDWFVETCRPEVLARFAELLGVPFTTAAAAPGTSSAADARRRQVANALAHRRRKGTLTVIDEVAADATGWPVRTQELRHRVSVTQSVRRPEPARGRLVDVGDGERLDRLRTAFSDEATLADVRRVTSHRSRGEANPSSLAVVLWRLLANGADRGEAFCIDDDTHFTFDPLGRDVALAVSPQPRRAGAAPAADLDVPTPISRQALHRRLEDYYGPDRSIAIYLGRDLVPRGRILVADLSDPRSRVAHGRVALDPELGRFAFADRPSVEEGVTVRYRHLRPATLGGGQYRRAGAPRGDSVYRVASRGAAPHRKVSSALRRWRADRDSGAIGPDATIEILDDATYTEQLAIRLRAGEHLEIRAAPGRRPVLRPLDADHDQPERLWVDGLETPAAPPPGRGDAPAEAAEPRNGQQAAGQQAAGQQAAGQQAAGQQAPGQQAPGPQAAGQQAAGQQAPGPDAPADTIHTRNGQPDPGPATGLPDGVRLPRLTFDGVMVAGHAVTLRGRLGEVTFRHCTLVPGSGRGERGGAALSLDVEAMPCRITVTGSLIGRIVVASPETGFDPVQLAVSDSVVDGGPSGTAVEGTGRRDAYLTVDLKRVTVLGEARVHRVRLVEDCLFTGPLLCEHRQTGDVRFSALPASSRTPRRTSCQPDGVIEQVDPRLPAARRRLRQAAEARRVTPVLDSVHVGEPGYARLADGTADELLRGAHDEGEMGAHHDQWLAGRLADLRIRLAEFTPAGTDCGVLFAT